jgi:hypothetical protein
MTGGNLIDAGTENGRSTPNLPAAGVKPASSPSSRGTGLVVAQKPVHRPEVADAAKESSLIAVKGLVRITGWLRSEVASRLTG